MLVYMHIRLVMITELIALAEKTWWLPVFRLISIKKMLKSE